ncbi:unnamed protein product [Chrysoparadoxa australica]
MSVVGIAPAKSVGTTCSMSTADSDTLYALGATLAHQTAKFRDLLNKEEREVVVAGLTDGWLENELRVDPAALNDSVNALLEGKLKAQAETMAAAGADFLAAAAKEDGARQTESGLVIRTISEGSGASPTASDKVTVHYTGTLIDGSVFDSSVARGEPTSFPLEGVIKGWTEALQLMKVGEKVVITIPPSLGYGEAGTGPIPANATLVFEVELISID